MTNSPTLPDLELPLNFRPIFLRERGCELKCRYLRGLKT